MGRKITKPPESGDGFPIGKIRTPEALGERVRAQRLQIGLTQEDAAGLAGVGPRFLGELERGKATVELGKVLRVLLSLGLDLEVRARAQP